MNKRLRVVCRKSPKIHRNPIFLAQEWQEALNRGEAASRADLARRLGVSRARVTQVLGLLTLSSEALRRVRVLGDPLERPVIAERQLRRIVHYGPKEQERRVKAILGKNGVGISADL